MSLWCAEHQDGPSPHPLFVAEQLYAASIPSGRVHYALCSSIVESIPREERLETPVPEGVDIHHAFSAPNGIGGLDARASWTGFQAGDRAFSLSPLAAEHYLPRILAQIRSKGTA